MLKTFLGFLAAWQLSLYIVAHIGCGVIAIKVLLQAYIVTKWCLQSITSERLHVLPPTGGSQAEV